MTALLAIIGNLMTTTMLSMIIKTDIRSALNYTKIGFICGQNVFKNKSLLTLLLSPLLDANPTKLPITLFRGEFMAVARYY